MKKKSNKWTYEKIKKLSDEELNNLSEEDKKIVREILNKSIEQNSKEIKKWLKEIREEWEEKFRKNPKLKEVYEKIERDKERREKKEKEMKEEIESKLNEEEKKIRSRMLDFLYGASSPIALSYYIYTDEDEKKLDEMVEEANKSYWRDFKEFINKIGGEKRLLELAKKVLLRKGVDKGDSSEYDLFMHIYDNYKHKSNIRRVLSVVDMREK